MKVCKAVGEERGKRGEGAGLAGNFCTPQFETLSGRSAAFT